MNHFIHIIKDIGLHMNGFASFISDANLGVGRPPNCSGHTGIAFPSLTKLNILSS